MLIIRLPLLLTLLVATGCEDHSPALSPEPATWHPVERPQVRGTAWSDHESLSDRLPPRAKEQLRPGLWTYSTNGAGLWVDFETDAHRIQARYTLEKDALSFPNMPATGVSGLDLYVRNTAGQWRWIATFRPKGQSNEAVLAGDLPQGNNRYRLYFPLYNGVQEMAIGVPPEAAFGFSPPAKAAPIVYYGSSIAQGCCASRPGMAFPSIVSRRLDHPLINLGLAGHCRLDPPLANLMAEQDAALYVIDCNPNLEPGEIEGLIVSFVTRLREKRPDTPLLLVENAPHPPGNLSPERAGHQRARQEGLQRGYRTLLNQGVRNIHYQAGGDLLGTDGEGTVDGTHPNDLGMLYHANVITPTIKDLLVNAERPN